jgi:hypothetical protein
VRWRDSFANQDRAENSKTSSVYRRQDPEFVAILHKYEGSGMSIGSALRSVMLDPGAGWLRRGTAAKVLAIADAGGAVARLLDLFFAQTDKIELWETALTIEHGTDRTAVPRLVDALYDENPVDGAVKGSRYCAGGSPQRPGSSGCALTTEASAPDERSFLPLR